MNSAGKEHGVEDGDHGAHAHQPELTVKSRLDFANGLQQVFFGSQMFGMGRFATVDWAVYSDAPRDRSAVYLSM